MDIKNKCIESINDLFNKYENNEYMTQRIFTHIINYLPNTIENEFINYSKRINKNTYLSNEQQIFIQVFLNKNQYYYLPNIGLFYEYNGKNYFIVKEDDIIHKLLLNISKDRVLLEWKFKTKNNVIKIIKERNLFNCIPESETIQNILNILYPTIFFSKNTAKYFLSIIGDNILKKNSQLIFLVNSKMKQFLNELDSISVASIGINSTTNNFITKYHENHSYDNCRLIKINDNYSNEVWREILKKIGLDLLCVSAHYSKRYENSDKFIETKSEEELKLYTYYLKNNTQTDIITQFCNEYITKKDTFITEWKNIHFVWKQFLSKYNLPNIIYSSSLKNMLKDLYPYDETSDTFQGITSIYLPAQHDFIKFWNSTITIMNENTNSFEKEIEIDELSYLFKLWSKETQEKILANGNISEELIIKIIKHFFPDIEIIEDKYILNTYSSLWNKEQDIELSLKYVKDEFIKNNKSENYKMKIMSFDELYKYYNKYSNVNINFKLIVSKRYFEKYLYYRFSESIVYENFLHIKYILEL